MALTLITYEPTNLPTLFLKELRESGYVQTDLTPLSTTISTPPKCILNNVELPILANQVSALDLYTEISNSDSDLVVAVCISPALTNPSLPSGKELNTLITLLAYSSHKILQFRPLKTGRANDITGRLITANGPRGEDVDASERQYFVKNNKYIFI